MGRAVLPARAPPPIAATRRNIVAKRRCAPRWICVLVGMRPPSKRVAIAPSARTNGPLTGGITSRLACCGKLRAAPIHAHETVLQPSRGRFSDTGSPRSLRRNRGASARRAEAAGRFGPPAARAWARRLERPADRRPLGRAAAADRDDVTAELHLPAPEDAGAGGAGDQAARLPATRP